MVNNRKEYHKKWWQDRQLNQPYYSHYRSAKGRCNNPNNTHYHRYGGRGITFLLTLIEVKRLWFRDKAYLLEEPSIDRKDNDGNYKYSNCRFIERKDNKKELLPKFHCSECNKQISKTSGKYGQGRCGSCAKSIDQLGVTR